MDYRELGRTGLKASAIGLGTWVMGGSLWGGAEDRDSIATIRRAIDLGINLIDTAPIYGHGRSEEVVGQAIQESGFRDTLILATKVGLNWDPDKTKVWQDSSRARITQEVEDSLRRLRTEYIDVYQVHWPDEGTPFEQTMDALLELQRKGKVRFIGLSNFSVPQLERCLRVGAVRVMQPPYNLLERGIEQDVLPFCKKHSLATLIYGPMCRGLLTGKYRGDETFKAGDIRFIDPKFQTPRFSQYADCARTLMQIANRHGKSVGQLAIRWCLDQPGVTVALCGARRPNQIEESVGAAGWSLAQGELHEIERVVSEAIPEPIGPEFLGPGRRKN